MRRLHPRRLARSSLAWLVWLALLLPVAQYASALHGLSHAVSQAQGEDKQAPHFAHCALCVTAAELSAGALPVLSTAFLLPAVRHAAPLESTQRIQAPRPAPAYRSRAPPAFHR